MLRQIRYTLLPPLVTLSPQVDYIGRGSGAGLVRPLVRLSPARFGWNATEVSMVNGQRRTVRATASRSVGWERLFSRPWATCQRDAVGPLVSRGLRHSFLVCASPTPL